MTFLQIFTPTYNRVNTLSRAYEALCKQTSKDFSWIIVDDGSTDDTGTRVAEWIKEGKIRIHYIFQENQGMLAAHNTALDFVTAELVTCVDSDDFLLPTAVEDIQQSWRGLRARNEIGGLVGLDVDEKGAVIGDVFPPNVKEATFQEIRFRYRLRGDKKYVFRSKAILEAGRYPRVHGEMFPAASYLYRIVDRSYRLACVNIPLCVVEYQLDGNSRTKIAHYKRHPNAFMLYRQFCMDNAFNRREAFTSAAHYVSASLFAGRPFALLSLRRWGLALLAAPVGVLLHLYIRFTGQKGFMQ